MCILDLVCTKFWNLVWKVECNPLFPWTNRQSPEDGWYPVGENLGWGMRPFILSSLGRQPHRASKNSLIPRWASVSFSVVASILKSKNWINSVSGVHIQWHRMTHIPYWYVEAPVVRFQRGHEGGDSWGVLVSLWGEGGLSFLLPCEDPGKVTVSLETDHTFPWARSHQPQSCEEEMMPCRPHLCCSMIAPGSQGQLSTCCIKVLTSNTGAVGVHQTSEHLTN